MDVLLFESKYINYLITKKNNFYKFLLYIRLDDIKIVFFTFVSNFTFNIWLLCFKIYDIILYVDLCFHVILLILVSYAKKNLYTQVCFFIEVKSKKKN